MFRLRPTTLIGSDQPVFKSTAGAKRECDLSVQSLTKVMKRCAPFAGFSPDYISIICLRKNVATQAVHTNSESTVRAILGHVVSATTWDSYVDTSRSVDTSQFLKGGAACLPLAGYSRAARHRVPEGVNAFMVYGISFEQVRCCMIL